MSTISCSECGEVSVETSRTVVLPFVCVGCESKHHDADPSDCHTVEPQVPLGYRSESLATEANFARKYEQEILRPRQEPLLDETATTTATVEMIRDLESQLAVAKELTQGQTDLIAWLEKQNAVLTEEKSGLKALVDASNWVVEVAKALAFHYGFVTEKVKHLEIENGRLRAGIATLQLYSGVELFPFPKS